MYAYIAVNPKSRWSRGWDSKPRIYEASRPEYEPRWREEDWSIGTGIFTGKKTLRHLKAGVEIHGTSTHTVWDARLVPAGSQDYLYGIDEQIHALQNQYQTYVEEHFREWPIMTQVDCSSTVKAQYANEKEAKVAMGSQPKLTAKQKREANKRTRQFSEALRGE